MKNGSAKNGTTGDGYMGIESTPTSTSVKPAPYTRELFSDYQVGQDFKKKRKFATIQTRQQSKSIRGGAPSNRSSS